MDALLKLHTQLHGTRGRPQQHVSELLRGALVLTMAALDAVVLDAVVNAIPQLARQGRVGKNLRKWVDEDPQAAVACFAAPDPHAPIQRSLITQALAVVRAVGTATCERVAFHVAAGR